MTGECDEIIQSVLTWWEEHQYDTTGYRGEYNMYDKEPEFVTIAKSMKEQKKG